MRPDALRRAEPDVAALMEAEGIAMRPGPRPVIAPGVLAERGYLYRAGSGGADG